MEGITIDARVSRRPDILDSRVGDSVFALDTASGDCFSFHGPSALLWELLAEPISAAEAGDHLAAHYDIEPGQCGEEIVGHLRELAREGLIAAAGS